MGALPDREPLPGADTESPAAPPEPAPDLRPVPAPGRATPEPGPATTPAAPAEQTSEAPDEAAPEQRSALRAPDFWDRPGPTLREEFARVHTGAHLPQKGFLRTAEQIRAYLSLVLITALLVAIAAQRSAGRQAVALLLIAAIALAL